MRLQCVGVAARGALVVRGLVACRIQRPDRATSAPRCPARAVRLHPPELLKVLGGATAVFVAMNFQIIRQG